jgi:sugar/nucleoside kinase (ribokinase family)
MIRRTAFHVIALSCAALENSASLVAVVVSERGKKSLAESARNHGNAAGKGRTMTLDVYLYGMTVLSTIHRLGSALSSGDGYGEILETQLCPGGETMNAAMLLSGLGLETAIGGPHWGFETQHALARYAQKYQIDVSGVTIDPSYPGVRDVVIVAGAQRTVLGWFGQYFFDPIARWGAPDAAALARARIVAIDPFFRESSALAAQLAVRAGKPYVTIDCEPESELHAHSAATVVAREYRAQHYPGASDEELMARYVAGSAGLTIFTSGHDAIRFGRRGSAVESAWPYSVEVKSTLGAGDTFRAGVVYALRQGFGDARCVRFASGLAALVCTRFPIADNVPSLAEVEAFLDATPAPTSPPAQV